MSGVDTAAVGILLTNLGSPGAPTPAALRRYLKQFLWDRRVVDTPRPLWWLALNGVILRRRPRRSAAAYAKIWTPEGSPLIVISRRQEAALREALAARLPRPPVVALGMRYGNPSIPDALAELRDAGVERLLVLPLYPQYSAATGASTLDCVSECLRGWRVVPSLRFVRDYHAEPGYVDAIAESIRRHWDAHGRGERLLLSFHGLPQRYVRLGDPYADQCKASATAIAAALDLGAHEWQLTFQSRFGPQAWLQPYTDKTLEALARQGVKSVDLVCPGFAADCLETLEENAILNRGLYLAAGGEQLRYIPCLNDQPQHIEALAGLIERELGGWV